MPISAISNSIEPQHLGPGDERVSVMSAGQLDTYRIAQVAGECILVRQLDQLDLERIAVVPVEDGMPGEESAAVIRQQRQHGILEGSQISGASGALPQQDA